MTSSLHKYLVDAKTSLFIKCQTNIHYWVCRYLTFACLGPHIVVISDTGSALLISPGCTRGTYGVPSTKPLDCIKNNLPPHSTCSSF